MPKTRASTPMSRRRRTTDIAIVLKMRNVLTNTAMNDSAVGLSANARTMFSTCFVRPCGSSAAAVGGSRRPSSARTESRRSGATSRSTRSRRPSRPKTSCAVAMSVITTLPPIACWSASDSITAAIVIGVGTPGGEHGERVARAGRGASASVRVIAIVRGSANRRRPAAAACDGVACRRSPRPRFPSGKTALPRRRRDRDEQRLVVARPRRRPPEITAGRKPRPRERRHLHHRRRRLRRAPRARARVSMSRRSRRRARPPAGSERPVTASTVSENAASAEPLAGG